MQRTCERCGRNFNIKPSRVLAGKGRFCSLSCQHPYIEGSCRHCGRRFRQRRPKHYFCNKECFNAADDRGTGYRNIQGVRAHVLAASRAYGKALPPQAVVHHVNGNVRDNRPTNLVICQDQGYHLLLHARTRLVKAGGDPDVDKICSACKLVKPQSAFSPTRSRGRRGRTGWCKPCAASWQLRRKAALKSLEAGPGE